MRKVDAVMAVDPQTRDREQRAVMDSDRVCVLSASQVDAFKGRPRFRFPESKPQVLFTSIDPSGGGAGSDYVILTGALCEGRVVVSFVKHAHAIAVEIVQHATGEFSGMQVAQALVGRSDCQVEEIA